VPTSQRYGAEAPEDSLAEENDPNANPLQDSASALTRRSRANRAPSRPSTAKAAASTAPRKASPRTTVSPFRSVAIFAIVGGLVATVALPAYGAFRTTDEAVTLQQVAADDAQTFVAASDATSVELARDSYSATTPDEIAKKKAAEAAAERARQLASLASSSSVPANVVMVSPGSGEVRWPVLSFSKGRGLWDSGYHQGVDLLAAGGTPIYAAAAGVVRVSQESLGGYGVAVTIDHVIAGQRVSTLYAHMRYGSRQVVSGQTVQAGQLIGLVGSTGSSTANHLHFEVHINGTVADPWAWLQANAG
jgi:murein DD-endopeptidase MepM/ murein hydrolase activator NlpD